MGRVPVSCAVVDQAGDASIPWGADAERVTEVLLLGGCALPLRPDWPGSASVLTEGATRSREALAARLAKLAEQGERCVVLGPDHESMFGPEGLVRLLTRYGARVVVEDASSAGPLFRRRVLVTRAAAQSQSTFELLRSRGAVPLHLPALEFAPPDDATALARAVASVSEWDWVLFTSSNGVVACMDELARLGRDARSFGAAKLAAIGPATAAKLTHYGLRADLLPPEFVGEKLAEALVAAGTDRGRPPRALLLRAAKARDVLPDELRSRGWDVAVVAAYTTRMPKLSGDEIAECFRDPIDAVTFTSSSTVEHLLELLGTSARRLLDGPRLASIGPITSATLRKHGFEPSVEASVFTVPGLVAALEESFARG